MADDENYLFFHGQLSFFCKMLAQYCARLNRREEMMAALAQARYHAEQADRLQAGKVHYTGTFIHRATHDPAQTTKNDMQSCLESLLEDMRTYRTFAPYREDPAFQALLI